MSREAISVFDDDDCIIGWDERMGTFFFHSGEEDEDECPCVYLGRYGGIETIDQLELLIQQAYGRDDFKIPEDIKAELKNAAGMNEHEFYTDPVDEDERRAILLSYDGGEVSDELLLHALDFFIDMERYSDDMDVYRAELGKQSDLVSKSNLVISTYGQQIYPKTADAMRSVLYQIIDSGRYEGSVNVSAVKSSINTQWNGINDWLA